MESISCQTKHSYRSHEQTAAHRPKKTRKRSGETSRHHCQPSKFSTYHEIAVLRPRAYTIVWSLRQGWVLFQTSMRFQWNPFYEAFHRIRLSSIMQYLIYLIFSLPGFYPLPHYSSLYVTIIGEKHPEISESLPVINLITFKISSNLVQVVKGLTPPILGSDSDSESLAASNASNTSSSSSTEILCLLAILSRKRIELVLSVRHRQIKVSYKLLKKIELQRKIRAQ